MNKYEEYNKQLMSCHCGGDVVLEGGTLGYPTFSVRCLRCGGRWSMDTYSPEEAVNKWGMKTSYCDVALTGRIYGSTNL